MSRWLRAFWWRHEQSRRRSFANRHAAADQRGMITYDLNLNSFGG
jgi:hypothetical protein